MPCNPACCAHPSARLGVAAFCSWRYRLNHRLTPGVRAHYSFKSCQLVTSWHQLIRREMIFKEPSVVTADPLTLSLRFAAMGEYYQTGASLGNYLKQLKQSPKRLDRKKQLQEFCSILVE